MDAENTMDGARKERRSAKGNRTKKNVFTKNQKRTVGISWIYNKQGGLGEFDTHTTDRRQK